MDSILLSIKKLLGIKADYTNFDQDIIMHINSVFIVLKQLGVGPVEGFSISDENSIWDDYIDADEDITVSMVKSYMYAKVRLLFDPPLSSALIDALNRTISEFEWRLNVESDAINTTVEEATQNE